MSDNVNLPLTGSGDSTALASTEEVTTLNGGAVTAQHVPRAIIAVRTADGTAVDVGKAEDAASATGDALIPIAAKRSDTPANTSGTDGDYEPLQVASGRLWTSATVDAALPAGTNAIGKLAANSGVDIGDVDVTSIVPGTGATNLGKAVDSVAGGTDTGVALLAVRDDVLTTLTPVDGDYVPLRVNAQGSVHATIQSGSLSNVASVDTLSEAFVQGDTAHDSVDAGAPLKIGGKARTTNPTAVANADRVNAIFDDLGRLVVVLNHVRDLIAHQHTQIASSSSETTIVSAVASTFLDLTSLVITNQTATAVNVTIKDATAGTTRMIIALAANGGAVMNFPVPVTQAAVNNNWTATLSSAAVTVNFFTQFVKNV